MISVSQLFNLICIYIFQMPSKPLLLIQTGTPPEPLLSSFGDLSDWFRHALGENSNGMQVVRVFEGEKLPEPGSHSAAIITGSWSMVSDQLDWSEDTALWIRQAMEIEMPLFGVCYGHQLIAHALGGIVGYHPAGIEIGCEQIELLSAAEYDPLTEELPNSFVAHLTHAQTVIKPPENAVVLAKSSHDPCQILRYGINAVSTQFHPEFTPEISAECVRRRSDTLKAAGRNSDLIIEELTETPLAKKLLIDFVRKYTINSD